MSRSAAKVRAEKNKEPKSVQPVQASTSPPVQNLDERIPGRLTQAEQLDLLISEDAEEIVGEIVDELLGKVMEGCYKVFIHRQLVNFSASWVKHYITQVVSQQLLCADEEEGCEDASKTEDPEPLPAISDAWAQGLVPVKTASPQPKPTLQQGADNVQHIPRKGPGVDHKNITMAQTYSTQSKRNEENSPRRPGTNKDCKGLSPQTPPKIDRKKKQQFKIIPKPVPGKFLPSLSCSTEKKVEISEGKTGALSARNHKTGPFYQPKTHQSIPKIDLSSLPSHFVCPLYEIVDNNCTKPGKPSGLSKIESKFNKHHTQWTGTSPKPLGRSKEQSSKFQRRNETDNILKELSPSSHRKEGIVPSASLRLDTMVLAKGVTLKEPEAAEKEPLTLNPPRQLSKLRPIQSTAVLPLFSADQITSGPPPQLTLLYEPKN